MLEEPDAAPASQGLAAYFRGLAREQQDNMSGARDDYQFAIAHKYGDDDVEVFRRLAHVSIGLGDFETAAIAKAEAAEPGHADHESLRQDLAAAQRGSGQDST